MNFNEHQTYANASTATAKSVSLNDLSAMAAKLKALGPTDEQLQFARDNGFISWDGIKVGTGVLPALKAAFPDTRQRVDASPLEYVPSLTGVPLVIDATLPPGGCLPCKLAWKVYQLNRERVAAGLEPMSWPGISYGMK